MAWQVAVTVPRVGDADLAKYKFYANGAPNGEALTPGGLDPISYTYSIVADGGYALTVSAVDAAGNESAQGPAQNVTLDHISPAVPGTPSIVTIAWV